eukprot:gene16988-20217_t
MLKSGHIGLVLDKIKTHSHVYLSNKAIEMITISLHDAQSFDIIYNAYRYRFARNDVLNAIQGGNMHAFKTLMEHHSQIDNYPYIFGYVVDHTPLWQPSEKGLYDNTFITPAHLERYMYIKSNAPAVLDIFKEHHILRLFNIELFDETFHVKTVIEERRIISILIDLLNGGVFHKYLASCSRSDFESLRLGDYLEHVLLACTMGDESVASSIKSVMTNIRSLSLTPEKETYIALLGFIDWIDTFRGRKHLGRSKFEFMIEWRDLNLNPFLLKTLGFKRICAHGTLAQVEAAHHQLQEEMGGYNDNGRLESKDIGVTKYIYEHGLSVVEYPSLVEETDMEIIKYVVTSPLTTRAILSKRFLFKHDMVDVIKLLATRDWLDEDNSNNDEDEYQPFATCRSIEMMQCLIETNHSFGFIRVKVRKESDLQMVKLYHGHMARLCDNVTIQNYMALILQNSMESIMVQSCHHGLLSIVEYIHSIHPDKYSRSGDIFIDKALEGGHMDVVKFIIANRKDRFNRHSWRVAAAADDIDLLRYVQANSEDDYFDDSLEVANRYGRLGIIKYITSNHHVSDDIIIRMLDKCLEFDHHHVLEYYLANYNQLFNIDIISTYIKNIISLDCHSLDRPGCLQVLIKHLPENYIDESLSQFIESLPRGTITLSIGRI